MEIQNKISEQVFDKLRSRFSQITLGDEEGNSTQDPTEAVFFNFNYVDNQGHNHGNITVSLIDRTMKIYYSKNISSDLSGSELTEWYAFLQDMRKTAMSSLYGFDTHDISKSALNVADIQSTVDRNSMQESKMYGSKKRSYQDQGPAKIIVRHTENINPEIRGSRSRKIESVFVETFEGERFKMPFESLPGTRAMAQHIGQGGRPYDDIGESIVTMVNEISSLRPFISRNRNAIYEDETTMAMVEAAKEYYTETRKSLGKLKGKRGYKAYAESFEITECGEFGDDDATAMKDRFTKKRFGDKMEAAMPIVQKAFNMKSMKPSTPGIKPITEFEEWADKITEMPEDQAPDDLEAILDAIEFEINMIDWDMGEDPELEALNDKLHVEGLDSLDSDELIRVAHSIQHAIDNSRLESDVQLYSELAKKFPTDNGLEEAGPVKTTFPSGPNAWTKYNAEQMGLSSHDVEVIKGIIQGTVEMDDFPDLIERLMEYYMESGEMPYGTMKARDGDPYQWVEDQLHTDFPDINESAMVKECACGCGCSKDSPCKCGPECSCGCNAVNESVNDEEQIDEVKSGTFNSKMVGRRVKVHGQSSFGDSEHNGEIGTITRASREPTFSQMHPFKVEYGIKLDNGARVSYRRENVSPIKDQTVEESHEMEKAQDDAKAQGKTEYTVDGKTYKIKGLSKAAMKAKAADKANKAKKVNEEQLDEGILQSIFTFMWNMSGKIPQLAANRKSDQLAAEFSSFKEKMDDATIDQWLEELTSKIKSTHPHTQKAIAGRTETIRAIIRSVKNSKNELTFEHAMQRLHGQLNSFKKFIKSSNTGVEDRKRKAKAKAKSAKATTAPPKANIRNNKLAQWVDKGAKGENIEEGTWAIPDNPDKQARLKELMSAPLKFGIDGDNASQALYDLIGDDDLFDTLADEARRFGPEADARPVIQDYLTKIIGSVNNERGDQSPDWGSFGESLDEDVILPKATYSDYLDTYKSSDIGGTDEDDDAKRMVKSLKKKGKDADVKAAKGALKRMAEQEAKTGLHINEGLEQLKQLRRDAGIIK